MTRHSRLAGRRLSCWPRYPSRGKPRLSRHERWRLPQPPRTGVAPARPDTATSAVAAPHYLPPLSDDFLTS